MEEEFTVIQLLWYHRFNIMNVLIALLLVVQVIKLIKQIIKDNKCHECIYSGECSSNTSKRGSNNRFSVLIKDSIVNSRVVTRHSARSGGDSKQRDR